MKVEPKLNRKQIRLMAFETKRNGARIKTLEQNFAREIIAIDADSEKLIANLEDSIYNNIYKKHLAKFVGLIELMERTGCYKFTDPNKEYFKKLYNPIDGTKITKTE